MHQEFKVTKKVCEKDVHIMLIISFDAALVSFNSCDIFITYGCPIKMTKDRFWYLVHQPPKNIVVNCYQKIVTKSKT